MSNTPDQKAASRIGRSIDGEIFQLNAEKVQLLIALARIAEIDAELAILAIEKARIDPRRPAQEVAATAAVPAAVPAKVDLPAQARVKSAP